MKIGIISGCESMFGIFTFLNKLDFEIVVYYDSEYCSYGDKGFDIACERVQKGIEFLTSKGVDKIILPPVYELHFSQANNKILPLYTRYVLDNCFAHSLVGKIGLLGDFSDIEVGQDLFKKLEKKYILSENQTNTKKFNSPFSYRVKEVGLWKHLLGKLGGDNFMSNKIVKFDLRYFKDAGVDTVIPMNYGFFDYQKTIFKFFNFKKTRFHKFEKLENTFVALISGESSGIASGNNDKKYGVDVFYTGHCEFLKSNKKLVWLMQRGKNIDINYEKII